MDYLPTTYLPSKHSSSRDFFCPFHPDIGFLMIRSAVALNDPPYVPTRERQHDRIDAYLYYSTRTYPEQLRKARKVIYNLNFAIVL
jgi:hypothetical protein